ncbi:ABC transporter substrate-binding protein [Acinetobacter sp. WZC-1]|uniref:ABC transporter substrate-binding protein n=1 Tax=Acinetobacter sp. WZC-1 TaxID=3459034 RepID=UPI00403D96C1
MKQILKTGFKSYGWLVPLMMALSSAAMTVQAKSPANPNKVLRYVFPAQESGFDPAAVNDLYSAQVNHAIFETLYGYDYLASPAKLVPKTATDYPEVSSDGLTYTIRIKKGIYFSPDPVFKGKSRELTSADYAYSFKRLLDPAIRSPGSWLFNNRIFDLDQLLQQARKTGQFNYDRPFEGIQTPDRYTLVIRLNKPDHNFPMLLAHQPAGAVAREVIEHYRNKAGTVMGHPIGTGPYMLTSWTPGSRIILKANPNYRGYIWDFKASSAEDQSIVDQMRGKKMPQIGVVDIRVMEEQQTAWLSFKKDEADMIQLEGEMVSQAVEDGKLKPELAQKGVKLSRISDPAIDYTYWNTQNPVVGGFSKEKIALRRAMAMVYSVDDDINMGFKGNARKLQYPIPYGVVGHDPNYKSSIPHSIKAANLLLDRYHYKVGQDGWRTQPDGQPLLVEYTYSLNGPRGQLSAELWKKRLNGIKINMVAKGMPFAEGLKAEKRCKTMFKSSAWVADYPDGDNFMQLFYGGNIHATNDPCFKLPEYDRLYEQTQQMDAGPERDALYRKMARLLEVYSPVLINYSRYRNILAQPRVIGYKKHPIMPSEWMYFDLESKTN